MHKHWRVVPITLSAEFNYIPQGKQTMSHSSIDTQKKQEKYNTAQRAHANHYNSSKSAFTKKGFQFNKNCDGRPEKQ